MSEPEVEVRPEDAVQVAQRALQKANENERENERLEERLDEAIEKLTAIQLRLSEEDDQTEYRDLSLDTKIGMVREHAFRKAVDGTGHAALDYDGIKWEVFDGKPGNNLCYRLLRLAAGYDADGNKIQDVRGFDLNESSRPMRLTVDAAEAKRGVAFSGRNNSISEEVL